MLNTMTSTKQRIEQLSFHIAMYTDVLNKLNKQLDELKEEYRLEQDALERAKRITQHKPTLSWDCFPQEVKDKILDFNGLLEENKKLFSKLVEPLIITQKYLSDIKQRQIDQPMLLEFEFQHTANYPGNFDVFLRGRHIINVHVDRYHIKHGWGSIMRWYDEEWEDMDDFIQFIIHHYIEGHPLPNRDWWLDY
jgi:uncharacterized coiled-coil protein SlyX